MASSDRLRCRSGCGQTQLRVEFMVSELLPLSLSVSFMIDVFIYIKKMVLNDWLREFLR